MRKELKKYFASNVLFLSLGGEVDVLVLNLDSPAKAVSKFFSVCVPANLDMVNSTF